MAIIIRYAGAAVNIYRHTSIVRHWAEYDNTSLAYASHYAATATTIRLRHHTQVRHAII